MKYLDYPILGHLSSSLSANPTPESRVHVRFELYSIKPIKKERKMFNEMEEAYMSGQDEMDEMSFSPEMKEAGLSSVFGRLDEKESRKMHFILVSTLNAAFPDHDFSGLRPDHFTREISAVSTLDHLSGSLLGNSTALAVGSMPPPPLPHSPSSPIHGPLGKPDLLRALREVIDLDDTEVYSWFPEPEYDPHIDPDDGENSDDGFMLDEEDEEMMLDDSGMDVEGEAAWGQAGMDMDDVGAAPPMSKSKSAERRGKISPTVRAKQEEELRRKGGLLWSANYFFHSRRQKRVLFITTWCRKRAVLPPLPEDSSTFPAPISSSFTPPSGGRIPSAAMHRLRNRSHNPVNARRRSKPNLRASVVPSNVSGTIPIRGMETPRPARLASSAPSVLSPLTTPQSAQAMAKMTVGGFRPRQTPARVILNAARESVTPSGVPTGGPSGISAGRTIIDLTGGDRVRKDRSESTTPQPLAGGHLEAVAKGAGKRTKV